MTNDYYELLQVHPRADIDAITASYNRLIERYDSTGMSGAALELAREKRATLDTAYATLSDPARRKAYDARLAREQAAGDIDYRPLPPAGGRERQRGDAAPATRGKARSSNPRSWQTPAIIAGILAALILPAAVLITNIPQDSTTTPPVSTAIPGTGSVGGTNAAALQPTVSPLEQFEPFIDAARQRAEANPNDIAAWIEYGNYLYDSTVIAREQAGETDAYQQRLPRWMEAADAYKRALDLAPGNAVVRSDYGSTYCFYGQSIGDQSIVQRGLGEVQAALETAPQEPRVLLNAGNCLVSLEPSQTEQALQYWQTIISVAPDDQTARQAQLLIDRYRNQ